MLQGSQPGFQKRDARHVERRGTGRFVFVASLQVAGFCQPVLGRLARKDNLYNMGVAENRGTFLLYNKNPTS